MAQRIKSKRKARCSSANQKTKKLLTYREYREELRVRERQNQAPGFYIGNKLTFGKGCRNVAISKEPKRELQFQSKHDYSRSPDRSPSPGRYNTARGHNFVSHKVTDIRIVRPNSNAKLDAAHSYQWERTDRTPDPGQYDRGVQPFCKAVPGFAIGDQSQNRRAYSPGATSAAPVLSRSRSTFISTPLNPFKQRLEESPDPGRYDRHLTPFASKVQQVTLSVRPRDPLWKTPEDKTMGPGKYSQNKSDSVTKPRVTGGSIR